MNKEMFFNTLRERLSELPQDDIEERLAFYSEMIDDRIEEGMTEEEAVAAVGSVDAIVEQIMSEIPLRKFVMKKVTSKKKLRAWEIVLLILGAPVWLPILISVIAVLLSVYIVLWAIVLWVYAIFISLTAGAVISIPCAVAYLFTGKPAAAVFMMGAALALTGLAIMMFFASVGITKGMIKATGAFLMWIKSLFVRKEDKGNE